MAAATSVELLAREPYGPVGRSAWMDVDWRRHHRFLRVEDRLMNIVELGSGPPVLLVHGLGGCWQNWLENIPELARDHRVIAVDLPGFGASEMPAGPVSIAGYARTLDHVCTALSIDAAAVVGNSMGGFVAAELAIGVPQRVERLVLVSAAGLQIAELRLERVLAGLAWTRLDLLAGVYGGWVAAHAETVARRSRLRRLMFAGIARHPAAVPWPLVAEQAQGFGRPGFMPAVRAMVSYPLRPRLAEIACPTLVVWGENDRLVPLRDASAFEQLIGDARKIVYPDTGHVPMLERPVQFNADLRAFLEEAPG
ncbi:MAG TPA: alpha/beta fold hydrolase [Solirubrobacteraceae bacterium]|nr:alpha/beta fold hydrolase [Solirubrobacteraceae bacterium]